MAIDEINNNSLLEASFHPNIDFGVGWMNSLRNDERDFERDGIPFSQPQEKKKPAGDDQA